MKLPTEHAEQVAVVSWLRRQGIAHFAVPNGAKMGAAEAAKMKREGLSRGAPDAVIVDRGKCVALEMKSRSRGARLAPEQRAWHEHLRTQGWTVIVAYGAQDAIAQLRELFGLDTPVA